MKFRTLLACVLWTGFLALGENTKATSEKMRIGIWPATPDRFSRYNVKKLPQDPVSPVDEQWDVREFFERDGFKLTAGETVVYKPYSNILVAVAKPETIDLIDTGFGGDSMGELPSNIKVEATLVEFSAAKVPDLKGNASVEAMRKAAGSSWRVLNRVAVLARSGQRAVAVFKTGSPAKKPIVPASPKDEGKSSENAEILPPGELGSAIEVEPVSEKNGRAVDLSMVYRYRAREPEIWEWKTVLTTQMRVGLPTIVQMNSAPPGSDGMRSGKVRVLVLRVDLSIPDLATSDNPGIPNPAPVDP